MCQEIKIARLLLAFQAERIVSEQSAKVFIVELERDRERRFERSRLRKVFENIGLCSRNREP